MGLRRSAVRSLGEIALRVNDLDGMQRFYGEIIGLELLRRFPTAVFFKIAQGYGGHTQILALFDRSQSSPGLQVSADRSTIDHIAFAIARGDFEAEKARLEQHGLVVDTEEHAWVYWRSLYVKDPEGNTVELVCYDGSV